MTRGFPTQYLDKLENLPLWQTGLILFLLTVVMRILLFAALHRWEIIMRSELEQVAISLATTSTFANPYHIPTGQTAHVAPIYPFLLSIIYAIFGTGLGGEWAEQAFNVFAAAAVFGMLPFFSLQMLGEKLPGIIAGAVSAVSPAAFLVETQGKEAPFASFVFLLIIFASAWIWRWGAFFPAPAVWYGLLWAVGLLTYPGFLFVMFGMLAMACIFAKPMERRYRYSFVGIVIMTCAVGLLPWIMRNYHVFGEIFFVRDNLGLELALSNHDQARISMDDNAQSGAFRRHPWASKDEALRLKELGEYRYHQVRKEEARKWMKTHPVAFAKLTAGRIVNYWFPFRAKRFQFVIVSFLNVAALVGLILLYPRNPRLAKAVGAVWLLYSIPYWFIQGDLRYSYPIAWSNALMAGLALTTVVRRLTAEA